ncbi:nucleoside triphosphate pyrophosphohydrolase [Psychromonas ossibalaenae]|uniref:nucleoside triphosphate pyrophosphohydrolase n=1 Tax=Psychromonas ossibalaenae TaxID=444922 RepID=UPI0004767B2D|nr:nucleoside triphosphate pyrophosphohydrolase [Psychromonas ossibalaenae]
MSQSHIEQLLNIMKQLRDPENGCPWDIKQTFASIVPHTIEEVYEVADAIEQKDYKELQGELGDLLFQVVFYAQMAKEQNLFEFDDIIAVLNEKLMRRHPHVFADKEFADEDAVHANWEAEKEKERALKAQAADIDESVLDNIPLAIPALSRAYKIQKRCANVGFDWKKLAPVVDKIKEELDEVLVEVKRDDLTDQQRQLLIEDELGDLLFANVNLVRHLKCNPEQVLRQANHKFEKRFRLVEIEVFKQGKRMSDCSLEELEEIWVKVKKRLNEDLSS